MPPAGLRPTFLADDGRWLVHDATMAYRFVVPYRARHARLVELGAPALLLRGEAGLLQRAVRALFLEGLRDTGDDDRPLATVTEDQPATVMSLGAFLRGQRGEPKAWMRQLDENAADNPLVLSSDLPGVLHHFRSWIEASALELVPLAGGGEVDEERLERIRIDRLAHRFSDAYAEAFGIELVMHPSHERPHADVYVSPPRPDGTRLLVTGGMSAVAMHDVGGAMKRPFVELACIVPADLDREVIDILTRHLVVLARYPTRRKTFLAAKHDMES